MMHCSCLETDEYRSAVRINPEFITRSCRRRPIDVNLLAQVMAAATYPDDIPDAPRWADAHHHCTGAQLTEAIVADHQPYAVGPNMGEPPDLCASVSGSPLRPTPTDRAT
jgi:hypothetical protein